MLRAIVLALLISAWGCSSIQPSLVQPVQVVSSWTKASAQGIVYFARIEFRDRLTGAFVVMTYRITQKEFMAVRSHLDACLENGVLTRCVVQSE